MKRASKGRCQEYEPVRKSVKIKQSLVRSVQRDYCGRRASNVIVPLRVWLTVEPRLTATLR